jgi:kynurenine formamidase
VLLDLGRHLNPATGELADGHAITTAELESCIAAQGGSSAVGRGDILLVRTGQLARARREGWGDYAGGPAPGLSLTTAGWLQSTEIAAIATDTWGFEVRPNEFDVPAFQPLHQVVIPNMGLTIGEMWDLELLADACAGRSRYDFLLVAATLPITGAVGSPVNPIAVL